jgi:hypothetical protein
MMHNAPDITATPESSSTNAQFVGLRKKIGLKKVKTCWFGFAKWFWRF